MKLKLADDLALPADEAVTQKYGFIGRSGSGKSYAAMRLAELFLEHGAQVIALDWVGIWWSLRLAADGKAPGFEHVYIFGGEHADVELRPESGALMADLVVDKHISVVLDVMHFRKAERTRFATAFAEQFFHRKKTARTACHLFIEEAQAYLPQMVRGDEARMVGVFEDIGKVGRNYGIGNSLISQRPQAINKDVLNQIEVLLAFQTNGPQERKAIAGWTAENTDAGAAMIQELPKLHVGDALVWSPQWLRVAKQVHISERTTYNASATPTQKAKAIRPKTLAKADLEALGEQITATMEKAKADDPRELKKQLAEANRMLVRQVTTITDLQTRTPIAKEKPVISDAQIAKIDAMVGRLEKAVEKAQGVLTGPVAALRLHLVDVLRAITSIRQPALPIPAIPVERRSLPSGRISGPRPPAPPTDRLSGRRTEGLTPVAMKILNALAELEQLGARAPARELVALLADYTNLTSKGFVNAMSSLSSSGLVHYPNSGTVALTDAGRAAADPPAAPRTAEDVQARICELLGGASSRILQPLIKAYPNPIPRVDVAEAAGYGNLTSKGFVNAMSRLRTLGFVDYPDKGSAVAMPVLFLEGR